MGHNSKKKKKRAGGVRSRGRAPSKDGSAGIEDDRDALLEETTALAAIFGEDFEIVTEYPHTQFSLSLRPHSNDMGFEDLNVSARLLVRCLPGYPHKCPKLQIFPEKGMSKEHADQLLSLLLDQANTNSREGRVMIYNLVEVAQEFLSEITPMVQSLESVPSMVSDRKDLFCCTEISNHDSCYSIGAFVCSSLDLYTDLCVEDVTLAGHSATLANSSSRIPQLPSEMNDMSRDKPILLKAQIKTDKLNAIAKDIAKENETPELLNASKYGVARSASKLNIVAEATDDDSSGSSFRASNQLFGINILDNNSDCSMHEDTDDQIEKDDYSNSESEFLTVHSYSSVRHDESQSKRKDLLLVHLLHLACSSKGSLTRALPEISSELYNLGILPEWAKDLASAKSSGFQEAFDHVFEQQMSSSQYLEFWKPENSNADSSSSKPNSRYMNDFEELRTLGRGGFGHVALCTNKLDGRQYAVKKIRLKDKSVHVNQKIKREVETLARLQHQHVVRYYQAWLETEYGNYEPESVWGSRTAESSEYSNLGVRTAHGPVEVQESTYLYIQMEYCPRTLRDVFESYSSSFEKNYAWHLFRQIVEGLAHIHSQGIIHRDLTPSNIFFDVRNDIKIGDFGLAKFLMREQLDPDQTFPSEISGISIDGTGQVGTYFYTAPEVEQSWPQINEKVDMYSLGVIFFELWHPFATAMERHIVLSDLKLKGVLPSTWTATFPDQSSLLRCLMSPSPSDRPSAIQLLKYDLPPRLEDEWLNDILRAMQAPEDTYVYDRVVSTIFDDERLMMRYHRQQDGCGKMIRNDSSIIQYSELDTETRDIVIEVSKEVFKKHCAKRLEISPLHIVDDSYFNRKTVKLLAQGGNMLELCHELRSPFLNWVINNQITFMKHYEVDWVYRRAIGRSTPSRFLQGDFDIIGGASTLMEAEVIKVAMDIITRFFPANAITVHLNHGQILESIWSWVGIAPELRQNVAELLSVICASSPQSSIRKSNWKFTRRQLLQDFCVSEAVVDKLQTADLRFCGSADQALARLRGALSHDRSTCKALEELSALLTYLRTWDIEQHISIDVLMPPTETYYRSLFFQIYLKENGPGSGSKSTLLGAGGRSDYLLQQSWGHEQKSTPSGAVGISIALEKIFLRSSMDVRFSRTEPCVHVLVCSRGGSGFLHQRMELVAELWQANIKAEFFPQPDPSLKEQYDYASERDIKCLIIIEASLSQTGHVKVRHLELKKERDVKRDDIVKFLMDLISTQFKNLAIWS